LGYNVTQKTINMNERMNSSQSSNLVALINIQPGAVVSRTLVDKKAGTVTLFAFDKDEGLSEHTAPYDAFLHVLEGEAEVKVAGKKQLVQSGSYIIMPANAPHQVLLSL